VVVRKYRTLNHEVEVCLVAIPLSCNDSGQVFLHTCASVTKHKFGDIRAVGKVSVGLASHWPCAIDLSPVSTTRVDGPS